MDKRLLGSFLSMVTSDVLNLSEPVTPSWREKLLAEWGICGIFQDVWGFRPEANDLFLGEARVGTLELSYVKKDTALLQAGTKGDVAYRAYHNALRVARLIDTETGQHELEVRQALFILDFGPFRAWVWK